MTFRPDRDTSRALTVLLADGASTSSVVRAALIEAAGRRMSAQRCGEAHALAHDASDRAESEQVLRDRETLRAW